MIDSAMARTSLVPKTFVRFSSAAASPLRASLKILAATRCSIGSSGFPPLTSVAASGSTRTSKCIPPLTSLAMMASSSETAIGRLLSAHDPVHMLADLVGGELAEIVLRGDDADLDGVGVE